VTGSVVVTGVGTVNALGDRLEALAVALEAGTPRLTEVDRSARLHLEGSARMAALVGEFDLARWIPPLASRRMSRPSRFAVAAARSALDDAGVEVTKDPDPGLAVSLATTFGPSLHTQRLLDQLFDEGPEAMSPSLFTECVPNAASSQVAIRCRASGPNNTICQREAGAILALARGAAEIRAGRARRALAGAVEEMTPVAHALLDRFGALARASDNRPERALPLDNRRNGFVAAEGATVLVLEEEGEARSRGSKILARVRGWGGVFDPTASRVGWGRAVEVTSNALRLCLERSDVKPREIDIVVSGASGARAGDRLEALTLNQVWGRGELPPVLVPKAVTGEYGGAFLAAALLALGGAPFAAMGFAEPDPELSVVPHDGSRLPEPRKLLISGLASGGAGSWLILERV